ncbi:MAG: hypothetical protein CMO81_00275 [Waddliaceae bacterium]|nr:hypothetical protein [Waddliaceae bacterium]|tara:strand:- start:364 stop:702 length:339 start_codon:yes stop_codon:yes gene_type:complete
MIFMEEKQAKSSDTDCERNLDQIAKKGRFLRKAWAFSFIAFSLLQVASESSLWWFFQELNSLYSFVFVVIYPIFIALPWITTTYVCVFKKKEFWMALMESNNYSLERGSSFF